MMLLLGYKSENNQQNGILLKKTDDYVTNENGKCMDIAHVLNTILFQIKQGYYEDTVFFSTYEL